MQIHQREKSFLVQDDQRRAAGAELHTHRRSSTGDFARIISAVGIPVRVTPRVGTGRRSAARLRPSKPAPIIDCYRCRAESTNTGRMDLAGGAAFRGTLHAAAESLPGSLGLQWPRADIRPGARRYSAAPRHSAIRLAPTRRTPPFAIR